MRRNESLLNDETMRKCETHGTKMDSLCVCLCLCVCVCVCGCGCPMLLCIFIRIDGVLRPLDLTISNVMENLTLTGSNKMVKCRN